MVVVMCLQITSGSPAGSQHLGIPIVWCGVSNDRVVAQRKTLSYGEDTEGKCAPLCPVWLSVMAGATADLTILPRAPR